MKEKYKLEINDFCLYEIIANDIIYFIEDNKTYIVKSIEQNKYDFFDLTIELKGNDIVIYQGGFNDKMYRAVLIRTIQIPRVING